jgi:flagellar biosynthesis component FlhA
MKTEKPAKDRKNRTILVVVLVVSILLVIIPFPMIVPIFGIMVNIIAAQLILTRGIRFDGRIIGVITGLIKTDGTAGTIASFVCFIIILYIFMTFIMKGSKRFTEITVCFVLDAMPDKMAAIETACNCGEINRENLIVQKSTLQEQFDFLGCVDGAFKFIAGTSKITLCIIVVVILGDIIINTNSGGQRVFKGWICKILS